MVAALATGLGAAAFGYAAWINSTASLIETELRAATSVVPALKEDISSGRQDEAHATVERLRTHTTEAKKAVDHPLWTLAATLPVVGSNFAAVTEVTRSADDVANLAAAPLVRVFDSLNWDSLLPSEAGPNLEPLVAAAPTLTSSAHAIRASSVRLDGIDTSGLIPQVAGPLVDAREQLRAMSDILDLTANAAQVVPDMLGAKSQRHYLLIIQNNAESRASGGIPGALAVLSVDNGKLTLGAQSSAGEIGAMSPVLPLDPEQQQIYSSRMGKFMQDVNLTPDFPSAAKTAQMMWERKTGQRVDGVVSIDPVALGYILDAIGPINLSSPELASLAGELPTELSAKNVVPTLLSEVYAKVPSPASQDAYFAQVAQRIFSALLDGKGDSKALISGLARGTEEARILMWSNSSTEQSVISKYRISGSIEGPSLSPAQFGVYFNDGTGAKMDYYVKRSVQLIYGCSNNDGYEQIKVRITSTNTAPEDAATSLPPYVTGAGAFGVPAGTVQTNIVAYGPVQAHVESATADGKRMGFASQLHSGRPVGTVTVALPPGKSTTVEFRFGNIVQRAEPALSVTPTVQPREDVILDPVTEECAPLP